MLRRIREFSQILFLLLTVILGCGCTVGEAIITDDGGSSTSSGMDAGDLGPCGEDCTKIKTPPCKIAVCNTGQELGPLNVCVVVPSSKGTPCDDGKFCTSKDICDNGACVGGTPNQCGLNPGPCSSVICYEELQSCDTAPVNDGVACTPTDLCQSDGVCTLGKCEGKPKDCSFSPLSECNKVACEPATGKCVGTPDPSKNNASCVLTGDLCSVNRTCQAGQCVGGVPKDCSALNAGCQRGVCDPEVGACQATVAPIGTACLEDIGECHVGACDVRGRCLAGASTPDGSACNDYNSCTKADTCAVGTCVAGSPVESCVIYFQEGFEVCPHGWTFGGDWQCGTPTKVGPEAAHIGKGVIATQIDGVYHVNQSYGTTVANSPSINLAQATKPIVSFWAWDQTEGGTFDGWNLKVSADGGQSFAQVTTVTPAYSLSIAGQPAWGGDHSANGWQNYSADLSAYVGKSIILSFAFRSDGATVFPGVYIDDIVVAEPLQIPLYVTTPSSLPDVYAGMAYSAQTTRVGGTSGAVWSIKPGGQNAAWLTIDPATGELKGTPSAADVGPVSVTVHVEEPTLPSNFADKTFTFNVKPNAYYTSFEGMCPNGWTLTGDWQCGVPMNVGPATAYLGTQCIATQIGANYSNLQSWDQSTATSPDISLAATSSPILTFRMWIDTEGSTYDGVNLKISADGGKSYSIVTSVSPAYPLMVTGQPGQPAQPAWGAHQSGLGWQFIQADLSAYAGQTVRLQFSFQSDSSGTFPGVYIDDIFVN